MMRPSLARRIRNREPFAESHLHGRVCEEKGAANGIIDGRKHLRYIHFYESDHGTPGTWDWNEIFAAPAAIGFERGVAMESFINMPPEIAFGLPVWRPATSGEAEVMGTGLPFLHNKTRQYQLT